MRCGILSIGSDVWLCDYCVDLSAYLQANESHFQTDGAKTVLYFTPSVIPDFNIPLSSLAVIGETGHR